MGPEVCEDKGFGGNEICKTGSSVLYERSMRHSVTPVDVLAQSYAR